MAEEQPPDRELSRMSIREQLGSRFQSLRGLRSRERTKSQDAPAGKQKPTSSNGPAVMSPRSRKALATAKQEALDGLPAEYYQVEHDSVAGELALLPRMFTEADLDSVVEERSGVLETVSERLSQHVLSNYSKFVAGVTEVASVERDLQEAHAATRASRSELANALAEVAANMVITTKQRQKHGLERMLGVLQQLREAAHLHDALRSSQENGEFAGSFWLCAQCAKALAPLSALLVTPELTGTVSALYEETVARLESSLQTVCADFQPDPYAKVLEGYVYLGNINSLGEEVMAAFAEVMGAAALKVVRGVVLTRPTPGLEERAQSTQALQELVKWLPPDLFLTCLSRVLMVVFEILSSHLHMARWHEARIEQHTRDLDAIQAAGAKMRERLSLLGTEEAASPSKQSQLLAAPAGNGDLSNGQAAAGEVEESDEEEDGVDAGMAAVVERTLQQAVVSKSLAAGRSGTLGTSDSLEAHAPAIPRAVGEGSSQSMHLEHASLEAEASDMSGSSSVMESAGPSVQRPDAADSPAGKPAAAHSSASSSSADLRASAEQQLLDTGQALPSQPSSAAGQADRAAQPNQSPAQPGGGMTTQPEEPLAHSEGRSAAAERPPAEPEVAPPTPRRASRRKSQADARGLEREYLEGELDALGEKEQEEVLWGDALLRVEEGLSAGRRWLWDEASRKVGTLIAAPSAFQGEHFLQVLEWTQTILGAGEAFCGSESATLRDALRRQSGRFFAAFHSANLQALHSMLEREVWKQLPMLPDGLPSIRAALDAPSALAATPFDTSNFGEWVAHGNPWHLQAYEDEEDAGASLPEAASPEAAEPAAAGDEGPAEHAAPGDKTAASHANGHPQSSGAAEVPPMTTSSLRLAKWLTEYAHLMKIIRSDAGRIWSAMAELFELYFLHTFHTFGDITIAALMSTQQHRQGGLDIVPVRLRNAVLRVVGRSRHRAYYLPPKEQPPAAGIPAQGAQSLGSSPNNSASAFNRQAPGPASGAPEPSYLSNPSNMYGLMERKVAVDSLRSVARLLTEAYQPLHDVVHGRTDIPENHSLDTFFSAVKATADLRDMVLRAAARSNLPIRWLPDRLAEQNFAMGEPPSKASPWVRVLMGHLQSLRQRLDSQAGLTPADVTELWKHAMSFSAEVVLEGIAKAGSRGKCTPMGRAAMSLDLQALQRGMAELAGPGGAEAAADALRIVDTYIKAYYLPWGNELSRWALTHPEYTRDQIMMLVVCIAEANGLKRKERNAFLTQMEAELTDFRPVQ